uniref:Histidine protein methyltransferase 1 homolog isoform X1 n=1 Tax=Rhizophora mucronata TaxID=61149 RepID=A0A2P2KFE1_RHIMU
MMHFARNDKPSFSIAGIMAASLIVEVADGSSNVREVWKFSIK